MTESTTRRAMRLIGIELAKLRARRMTLTLLLVYLGLAATLPWMFYLSAKLGDAGDEAESQLRTDFLARAAFPGALENSISIILSFGVPLVIILSAAAFGGEFAWGTLRLFLIRGEGRGEFVVSKLVALFAIWVAAIGIGLAVSLVSSWVVTIVGDLPGPTHVTGADLVTLAGHVAAALGGGWVYIGMTSLAVLKQRSTAFGIAFGLILFFGDRIAAAAALSTSIGPLEILAKSGINYNLRSLTGETGADPNPMALAVFALAAYLFGGVVGSLRQLRRQDVAISGVG